MKEYIVYLNNTATSYIGENFTKAVGDSLGQNAETFFQENKDNIDIIDHEASNIEAQRISLLFKKLVNDDLSSYALSDNEKFLLKMIIKINYDEIESFLNNNKK